MTDPELEDLLRRYRPSAPPPDLRGRIVPALPADVRRAWPWAAAAAVLFAAVGVLQLSTRELYRAVDGSARPAASMNLDDLPALRSAVEQDPLLQRRLEIVSRDQAIDESAVPGIQGPS